MKLIGSSVGSTHTGSNDSTVLRYSKYSTFVAAPAFQVLSISSRDGWTIGKYIPYILQVNMFVAANGARTAQIGNPDWVCGGPTTRWPNFVNSHPISDCKALMMRVCRPTCM